MTKTANVAPGTRITSAWGNNVRDRSVQRFATKSELDLTWSDAGDGAMAITLDDYRLWVRRGGRWLPPLTLPLGMFYNVKEFDETTRTAPFPPGVQEWSGDFDQYPLLAGRLYEVLFSARYELASTITAGTVHNFGAVINVTATGADAALIYHAGNPTFLTGQEACVFGWPFRLLGDAFRAGTSGVFSTAGTPGTELDVKFQHVLVGFSDSVKTTDRRLSVVDLGPAI